MEEEKLQPVKISAVVRAVKEQGVCMLIDRDDEYYLVTGNFILKLRRKDMWRIQCKLEIEKRNVYMGHTKEAGWVQTTTEPKCAEVVEKYISLIEQAAARPLLQPTGIAITMYHDIEMDGRLYHGADGFALIHGGYLDMIPGKPELVRLEDYVVVNDTHVITIMLDDAWQENQYVTKLREV